MEKTFLRTGRQVLFVMFFLVSGVGLIHADDFDGTWILNANGWKYTLKVEQKGNTVTGTITGINSDDKNTIKGKIKGNEITFKRGPQEYQGYLLNDDPTKKANNQAMAGTFVDGTVHAGWYATR